ncbi:potassium transporter Kup [Candidatus Methylopumilus universalis]|jgi:KUP system potassium uptake protein|uniref:potassium transporter Kup n=1 Tax=Candidatus Methylopumilus TaxID=1679002 RepID=UPI00111D2849|nr:potassium transporter Kup [Candidatus Methylopumilus universalis]MCF8182669.1 potassium transporter Kup [Limnohabitans sp.]QDC78717.1 potassium transporter Kup [Candidatus Methylopumilus universalis]QDC80001.1 potassium transporter Kup [Candidatus Methylopumilus universalis]QDC81302.1 potassium transporter Kup [Candidatus Methylopumilus universalis]QDC87740.1 potassium transporter Kup [Candidatus Methylopumilus universalis]
MEDKKNHKVSLATLSLSALGVVFGDIGTSPLYTMKEVFSLSKHPVELTQFNVLGILSLIFWSLIMIVSVKYVAFIMRADNRGEGGIMALLSLANKNAPSGNKRNLIVILGILGACMFYADGMITPAISVLSAIEGLEVVAPSLSYLIIPITLAVLFILFYAQSKGTNVVGAFFGPIMFFWFLTLALLGIINIAQEPHVLEAINPLYAFHFFQLAPMVAFVALGAVVLSVTGAEALYADMGHFGRQPIRLAWFIFVLPALTLNYFGQGALIISNPENIKNPFYLMAPEFLVIPLIILATLAAIIASQAVITGAFSVSRQALLLGFLPRMHVEHTSENQEGQIYLPRINWLLMIAVMALVVTFKSSGNLAGAYGIAVTGDMVISTLLASFVFYEVWKWNSIKTVIFMAIFLIIDLAFFSANILKIPDGGWFPILIGTVIFILMTTWKKGRALLYKILKGEAIEINSFITSMGTNPPPRVEGTAIFLTPNPDGVPHALLHNLKHNKVIHEKVIILTVMFMDYPHSLTKDLVTVEKLPHNFYKVTVKYGFKDEPDLPKDLALHAKNGINIDPMNSSYFIGKEILLATPKENMNYWRKKLFIGLFRSAETITNQFKLPPNRVVELGSQVLF